MEPRARALILLVRRWAKDRGICHAAKGHLPPYAWCALTIYFLQVGLPEDGPFLPPLEEFKMASGLMGTSKVAPQKKAASVWSQNASQKPVGVLFKQFMQFYHSEFDWHKEVVSVRLGKRGQPDLALPLHIIVHADGKTTEVGPSVENPFAEAENLSKGMNVESLKRLHEEFSRGQSLVASGGSLGQFLEPWAPPVQEEAEHVSNSD